MGLDKEDIKQLIAILQKGLSDDGDDDEDLEETVEPKETKQKTRKTKRKNLFESMPEFRKHKDDVEIDKKLRVQPPTPRTRTYQPISVRCRVCGKEEKINPSLVESRERYKCNKCCASPG
jgi:hypothetical protein